MASLGCRLEGSREAGSGPGATARLTLQGQHGAQAAMDVLEAGLSEEALIQAALCCRM